MRPAREFLSRAEPEGAVFSFPCLTNGLTGDVYARRGYGMVGSRNSDVWQMFCYSGPACQTGIIRTGFSAADFRLNRVIRLANAGGY